MLKKPGIWFSYFFGFILLIFMIIAITGSISISLFNTGVEEQARIAITKDLDAAQRMLYRRQEMLLLYLDALSCNTSFQDLYGKPGLRDLLIEIKNRREFSFVYIVEPDGTIVASANNGDLSGKKLPEGSFMYRYLGKQMHKGIAVLDEDFLAAEGLVHQARIEVRTAATVETRSEEKTEEMRALALVASVPFFTRGGHRRFYLIAGDLLNRDQKYVDEVSALLRVYTTVFLGDLRIATSIRLKDGERALGTPVAAEVAEIVLREGRRYLGMTTIIDQRYLAAYEPIRDDRGEIIGMLFVGIPEAPFISMKKDTLGQYALVSILSILLALVIAYTLSRTITNPLHQLIDTMKKVELGDLSQRVNPQFSPGQGEAKPSRIAPFLKKIGIKPALGEGDEIQQLGNIFNRMMASLQANWEHNQKLQQSLKKKESNRIQLLRKIINIQEEERKRIARELHDETSQSLSSLLLILKTIQQSDDLETIRKLSSTLRGIIYNTLEEIQKLSYELRPMALDKLGIDQALQRYITELARHTGANIHYDNEEMKFSRLDPAIETTLYRIVQEALTNAIRHAKAQNINITLQSNTTSVTVAIEDDGKGFDLQEVLTKSKEALGLVGMMERASLAGGWLKIETAPGKGTRVLLTLPLLEKEDLPQSSGLPVQEQE